MNNIYFDIFKDLLQDGDGDLSQLGFKRIDLSCELSKKKMNLPL